MGTRRQPPTIYAIMAKTDRPNTVPSCHYQAPKNMSICFEIMEMEKIVTPILVVNNGSLRPYIEAFHHEPENVIQQPLGILVGYFEVREYSDDSAYVVNFLTSVIKKEYYINPKRSVPESLDAALHKANLALSELAKHGNVSWLGNLDAAICVLEKTSLHFSAAGKGSILLARKDTFSNISEGITSDESQQHPLKTFVQVASGKIENGDRIIIASNAVFSILSTEELKKNSFRLNGDKFPQFLKTALSNKLDIAYASCISIAKKAAIKSVKKEVAYQIPAADNTINAFSRDTFARPTQKSTKGESNITSTNIEKEKEQSESEYSDKKTGHIYVQGEDTGNDHENSQWKEYLLIAKEEFFQFSYETKEKLSRKANVIRKDFTQMLKSALSKKDAGSAANIQEYPAETVATDTAKNSIEKTSTPEKHLPIKEKLASRMDSAKEKRDSNMEVFDPKRNTPKTEHFVKKETAHSVLKKSQNSVIKELSPSKSAHEIKEGFRSLFTYLFDKLKIVTEIIRRNIGELKIPTIMPSIQRIKRAFFLIPKKNRLHVMIILFAIIFLPLVANKLFSSKNNKQMETETTSQPTRAEIMANETNIVIEPVSEIILQLEKTSSIISTKQDSFAVAGKKLLSISNNIGSEFVLPEESGMPIASSYMKDLDLIFILTDAKKIISFSPATKQFKENSINLKSGDTPPFIATYLTYLYIPDISSDDIYRYPRAEGGFGEPASWLKDKIPLDSIKDGTIDENVYISQGNEVIKLFKGKKELFNLQKSATPIFSDKLYTTLDSKYLYILDKKNARIIKYEKDSGNIIKQYLDESFSEAASFSISYDESFAFIATPREIIKLEL